MLVNPIIAFSSPFQYKEISFDQQTPPLLHSVDIAAMRIAYPQCPPPQIT